MVRVESSFDNGEGLNLVQFAGRDLKRLIKILKTARESGEERATCESSSRQAR